MRLDTHQLIDRRRDEGGLDQKRDRKRPNVLLKLHSSVRGQ